MSNLASCSSFATATTTNARRRESARTVIQRLHAIPVQLFPTLANGEGGVTATRASGIEAQLGANSVCLLTTSAQPLSSTALGGPLSAAAVGHPLRNYAHAVAASHALRGGRVLLLCGPASASFSLANFTLQVERQWVVQAARHMPPPSRHDPPFDGSVSSSQRGVPRASSLDLNYSLLNTETQLRARQHAVIEAVSRVEVLACASMADVYAVCHAYVFPSSSFSTGATRSSVAAGGKGTPAGSSTRPESHVMNDLLPPTDANPSNGMHELTKGNTTSSCNAKEGLMDAVPLCVVESLTGPTTVTTLQERATGQFFPIPHYLLCLLQRRLQCALLVVELPRSMVSIATEGRYAHPPQQRFSADARTRSTSDNRASPLSEESVLADSDFVRQLRLPHEHLPPNASRSFAGASENAQRRRLTGKAARMEGTRDGAERLPQPPVSLHNIHFLVVYVEVDGIHCETPCDDNNKFEMSRNDVFGSSSFATNIISPGGLSLRYRLHLMKTSLAEVPPSARGSHRLNFRGDEDDTSSSRSSCVRQSGSGGWGSGSWSARSSRRNFTAAVPMYSGTWLQSTEWRDY
ncbi:hypothetical protein ABL78_7402 [Leptomonas seymouri]|uniref:Uncharacterized protein n=1 Tax=Leptomonas seymouri TaxID=5684 RepID=A0A0N1HZL6_LEPSE|nr:hypothetical protein ABL78_7402 [Leptomonas seymouri]|eukprot:KPI83563.1 hypothetical protein ABL78_7402 [Leptomonas seymouri]